MKSYHRILEELSDLMSCPSKIFSLARTGKHPADKWEKNREKKKRWNKDRRIINRKKKEKKKEWKPTLKKLSVLFLFNDFFSFLYVFVFFLVLQINAYKKKKKKWKNKNEAIDYF